MATIGDFASILQVGFEINAVTSLITIFVNPSLVRAKSELERFRVWLETREQRTTNRDSEEVLAAATECLSSWQQRYVALEHLVQKTQKIPITVAAVSAGICAIGLVLPLMVAPAYAPGVTLLLAFGPIMFGGLFILHRTGGARGLERKAADEAKHFLRLQ